MMKAKKTIFIALAVFLQITLCVSCVSTPKESPILKLTNIALDGKQWLKARFTDEAGAPIAVDYGEQPYGKILAKTDERGILSIRRIPDSEGYYIFISDTGKELSVEAQYSVRWNKKVQPEADYDCAVYVIKDENSVRKVQSETDSSGTVRFGNISGGDKYCIQLETMRHVRDISY